MPLQINSDFLIATNSPYLAIVFSRRNSLTGATGAVAGSILPAWVMGNHEFDWGLGVFADATQRSNMPIITGNVTLDGKLSGKINGGSFAKVNPWIKNPSCGQPLRPDAS